MSYYEQDEKKMISRGIDYNLGGCLTFNKQPFEIEDIEKVLAVVEGSNDGDDWRWVIRLTAKAGKRLGGRYAFLQGGCDYTGWDCRSWASSEFASTALKAAAIAKTGPKDATIEKAVTNLGLGRLISAMSGSYMDNAISIYEQLCTQLKAGKAKTWREEKEDEFRNDLPKLKH